MCVESRCSSEIKVLIDFNQILLVFDVPSWPRVKAMSENSYTYQKLITDTLNLTLRIIRIVCVWQISLGLARVLKKTAKIW